MVKRIQFFPCWDKLWAEQNHWKGYAGVTAAIGIELNGSCFCKQKSEICRHCTHQWHKGRSYFPERKTLHGSLSVAGTIEFFFHRYLTAQLRVEPTKSGPGIHPLKHVPCCLSWVYWLTRAWVGHPPCASVSCTGHQQDYLLGLLWGSNEFTHVTCPEEGLAYSKHPPIIIVSVGSILSRGITGSNTDVT